MSLYARCQPQSTKVEEEEKQEVEFSWSLVVVLRLSFATP